MSDPLAIIEPDRLEVAAVHAQTTDQQLIDLWLHGRCRNTTRGYRAEVERLLTFTKKSLHQTTLGNVQAYADSLLAAGLEPATRRRMLASIKSLFAFGHQLGYLPFDTSRPLRLPALRDTLSDRIIDESHVQRMLAMERHPRNAVMLTLLYATGVRVSELCGIKWSDCCERNSGGQITVLGKGSKTRTIRIPTGVWQQLITLRGDAGSSDPVFRSREGRHLCPSQVLRIVKKAAARAGIDHNVVVHTLRHAHASHALERGAPIHLVQATLGHSQLSTTGRYLHARPTESSGGYLAI